MVESPGGGVAPKEKPQVVERVAKILGAISSHGALPAFVPEHFYLRLQVQKIRSS